jgi:hypothetical protein
LTTVGLGIAAVFGIAGATVSAQERLTAGAIQQSLADKRVSLSCIDGTTGSGRYVMARNFGTITGIYKRPGGESEKDVGRVRAEGDQLCLKFSILNNGEERCFSVRQQSKGRFAFTAFGGLVNACQVAAL